MGIVVAMGSLLLWLPVMAAPTSGPADPGTTREKPAPGPEVRDVVQPPPDRSPKETTLESFEPSETVPAGNAISFPADI